GSRTPRSRPAARLRPPRRALRPARTSCRQPTARTIAGMRSRFISAVAFYGPKTGPLRELLTGVRALIAEHVGADFRPYSLEQVHATLIALDGVRDPQTGAVVNAYLLAHAGLRREMDLPRVMDILAGATPLRVRIGGFRPGQEIPFTSRGQHLAERAFCVQDQAFVLMGWPTVSLAGAGRPDWLDAASRKGFEHVLSRRRTAHRRLALHQRAPRHQPGPELRLGPRQSRRALCGRRLRRDGKSKRVARGREVAADVNRHKPFSAGLTFVFHSGRNGWFPFTAPSLGTIYA